MDAGLDFLAIFEHRLIPARVRSEWARLKSKEVASLWAPASQDSTHVGNAGVGVFSVSGALVSFLLLLLPSSRGSLTAGGRSGVRCRWVLVGLCIWLFCMVTRVLMLILSSLL